MPVDLTRFAVPMTRDGDGWMWIPPFAVGTTYRAAPVEPGGYTLTELLLMPTKSGGWEEVAIPLGAAPTPSAAASVFAVAFHRDYC